MSPPTKQSVVGLGSVGQEEELVQSGGGQKLLETSPSMSLYLSEGNGRGLALSPGSPGKSSLCSF